jgi:hypothetical protein
MRLLPSWILLPINSPNLKVKAKFDAAGDLVGMMYKKLQVRGRQPNGKKTPG